jgi:hypothetical protein
MRKTGIVLLFLLTSYLLSGQELRCNVQIVSQQIQGTNKQVFETLQNAIYEFMNNRVWTNHVYSTEERIECNLMFNITEQLSADEFKGTLQVQARRPVFNTNYNTTTFNFVDNDIHFRYVEFSPLEFDLYTHTSSLTSILAFYAYYILGLDYDTFSLFGGTPFFTNAEKIVMNAQSANAPEAGWKPMDDLAHKSRYWIVKDMLDAEYEPVREFNYRYHRLGLDVMDEDVAKGRAEITNSLELLQQVYRKRPDPYMYLLRLVFDAKADELVNVYTESYPEERNRAHTILTEVDKTNSNKYDAILEQTGQVH